MALLLLFISDAGSVVMGAKQCVVDKVRGVNQQWQLEIRLTRASAGRISIADKRNLGTEGHITEGATAKRGLPR